MLLETTLEKLPQRSHAATKKTILELRSGSIPKKQKFIAWSKEEMNLLAER